MADETTQADNQDLTKAQATSKSSAKIPFLRYIVFGAAGLFLTVVVVVGTLLLVGTGGSSQSEATGPEKPAVTGEAGSTAQQPAQTKSPQSEEDSILATLETDQSVLENIMKNLEFLDYQPVDSELATGETGGMSPEDSIKEVNWIESEKTRLAEWEKDLKSREKELRNLDKKVSQKVLKLEQAESTRTANLAKLYDGMEARSVAKLMANLDDDTVVSILPRMKQKQASQVLALMSAKRAARLSKQMITIAEN
ncbi:MAG: hypothetical protein JSU65_09795 [Candidatus Zixiibacteriota bacterium]|nr:MAG: hypothetical protein JSU65_09795 [candidate division Zixibacteria bacterium]